MSGLRVFQDGLTDRLRDGRTRAITMDLSGPAKTSSQKVVSKSKKCTTVWYIVVQWTFYNSNIHGELETVRVIESFE